MDRINGANTVNITSWLNAAVRGFRKKNKANGVSGTEVTETWCNNVQEEILTVIEAAWLTPSDADRTQLNQALPRGVFSQKSFIIIASGTLGANQVGSFIVSYGAANITATLPSTNVLSNGAAFTFCNSQDVPLIITSASTGIFDNVAWGQSISVAPGETVTLTLVASGWIVSGVYALRRKAPGALVPVGSMLMWPFSASLPSGFLKLNGAAISRSTYAALWTLAQGGPIVTDAAWNTAANNAWGNFSSGDGSTTFRLPDLRGEFPRFFDDGRGVDSGRAMGAWQGGTVIPVDGNPTDASIAGAMGPTAAEIRADPLEASIVASYAVITGTLNSSTNGVSSPFAAQTRPRNIPLIPLIRAL